MVDTYVGLMSGTSMDGIDAVAASFGDASVEIHAKQTTPYPDKLRDALLAAIREPLSVELDQSGDLNRQVGECFRDAARTVIDKSGVDNICAIGSHGQTLRHQPNVAEPFSLQVGDADLIAAETGIPTVANFRQADMGVGGQGAPLTPPFHQWLFSSADHTRVVVNIGGIANVTILPTSDADVLGFDTGPGNSLMDIWIRQTLARDYDDDGRWARSGDVIPALLEAMLDDDYFSQAPPKSTGFEYFNSLWLENFGVTEYRPVDVQATLCELTAATIALPIAALPDVVEQIFICGGGAHNSDTMRRLQHYVGDANVVTTTAAGLNPEWVEAVAFAWLAMRTMNGETGNLPSVTGASHKVVLGDIHSP